MPLEQSALPGDSQFNPISSAFLRSEPEAVDDLLAAIRLAPDQRAAAESRARGLIAQIRRRGTQGVLPSLLREFGLSTEEGLVLMCLAEALLRIPDARTVDDLIREKLSSANWHKHLGAGASLFVNASALGLILADWLVDGGPSASEDRFRSVFRVMLSRYGETMVRHAVLHGMRLIGRQFVMGETIEDALARGRDLESNEVRMSFDMLGEAALTRADADAYFNAYMRAIDAIGEHAQAGPADFYSRPGISIKLSALHPRYSFAQRKRVLADLVPCVRALSARAMDAGVSVCIDAEEADRLELSLEVIRLVLEDEALRRWEGFGLAVQAYQKRAPFVIDWLVSLSRSRRTRFMVRLVKGAYWDTEIKRAQERGLADFPVFTRKAATDLSYLACARKLLSAPDQFYPQFASHNALTVASIVEMQAPGQSYEFQRLHGMGEGLYEALQQEFPRTRYRVYAPVGSHRELLPYLVRRLLENGANSSFVNGLSDPRIPVEQLVIDPVAKIERLNERRNPRITLPADLFAPGRVNSNGIDPSDQRTLAALDAEQERLERHEWTAGPLIQGRAHDGVTQMIRSPANRDRIVGAAHVATAADVEKALELATAAFPGWAKRDACERARLLELAGDRIEAERARFLFLLIHEAGKTVPDALSEIREAVDFCRFYAQEARAKFTAPVLLPGSTGEKNLLSLRGRGVFVCISPWNFPMAIFLGQIAAALAAGNTVIAKPAEQTPLVGAEAVRLLHSVGIPEDVLSFVPGPGPVVGKALVSDPRVAGVAFTGSTETAWTINRALAARDAPIAPLIAETGGLNAMIVDSSALLEQVVSDAIVSAFNSAGQRCSALRILFAQSDIADRLSGMLHGAMKELSVGDPALLSTDVGPVIDENALGGLHRHINALRAAGKPVFATDLPDCCNLGTFCAPTTIRLDDASVLRREVFGPVLHIVPYEQAALGRVLDAIRGTGYGLTLGIHTRMESRAARIAGELAVGNIYVNRNMIGAVVGVQPFGGDGLSGTGPKAGGPHYLLRFAAEKTLSINTMAIGGNASLMAAEDL